MNDYGAGDGRGTATAVEQAQEKVQQTAQRATHKAAEVVRGGTEQRAQQLGDELQTVADALRRSGHALHADGREQAASAVDGVTRGIEQVSRYLGGTSGDRMLHDLEAFGRRRPWGMIGVGLGLGVAASRFLKASSRTRYAASQQSAFSPPALPAVPQAGSGTTQQEPGLARAGYDGSA
jgi:hypothetical protein